METQALTVRPDAGLTLEMSRQDGLRRPDEAEVAVMAFFLHLDAATQRQVFARMEEVVQPEVDTWPGRLRRVALALHRTSGELGRSPSVREYKRLREAHSEQGWPDARSLTRWLGVRSWNDALVRMGLDAVLDGDAIERADGPTFTFEEVIEAVRDCAEDIARVPTITDYIAWQHRPDVRERPGRRPAGSSPFVRLFGSFPKARVAAGVVDDSPTAAILSDDYALRTANWEVTDEQILHGIQDVAARTSGYLRTTVYDRERRTIYLETRAEEHPRVLAATSTILTRYGSWADALRAAGIDRARIRARPGPDRRHTNDEIVQALTEAHQAIGGPLSLSRYTAWRAQHDSSETASRRPPCKNAVVKRFGSWSLAVAAAGGGIESGRSGGKHGAGQRHTDTELLQALRDAYTAVCLDENVPAPGRCQTARDRLTILRYEGWRAEQDSRSPELKRLPSSTAIRQRFGGWGRAIGATGIGVKSGRAGSKRCFSDAELLQALRDADMTTRGRLTSSGYANWREQEMARDPAGLRPIPTYVTICQRFGGWQDVLRRLREAAASQ